MTEFCPVLPEALYPLIAPRTQSRHYFVHAPQMLGHHSESLREFLDKNGSVVYLDCFAFELGGQMPAIDEVYEAASLLLPLRPELVIVCPDVVKQSSASFALLRQHGPALRGYGRLIVVPHGTTLIEWMESAERSLDFCRQVGVYNPIVGLPRYMSEWGISTRYSAACWIHHYYSTSVHLLGSGHGLEEVVYAAAAPNVVSCDSTSPFAFSVMHGVGTLRQHFRTKVEMLATWWGFEAHDVGNGVIHAAQVNIAMWKEELSRAQYTQPHLP